jgi:hypothetical protein
MKKHTYFTVTACIFGAIAVLHLTRLIFHWAFVLGSFAAPLWISLPGVLIPGWIAWQGARLAAAERR